MQSNCFDTTNLTHIFQSVRISIIESNNILVKHQFISNRFFSRKDRCAARGLWKLNHYKNYKKNKKKNNPIINALSINESNNWNLKRTQWSKLTPMFKQIFIIGSTPASMPMKVCLNIGFDSIALFLLFLSFSYYFHLLTRC